MGQNWSNNSNKSVLKVKEWAILWLKYRYVSHPWAQQESQGEGSSQCAWMLLKCCYYLLQRLLVRTTWTVLSVTDFVKGAGQIPIVLFFVWFFEYCVVCTMYGMHLLVWSSVYRYSFAFVFTFIWMSEVGTGYLPSIILYPGCFRDPFIFLHPLSTVVTGAYCKTQCYRGICMFTFRSSDCTGTFLTELLSWLPEIPFWTAKCYVLETLLCKAEFKV